LRALLLAFLALLLSGGSVSLPAPGDASKEQVLALMHQAADQRKSGDYAGAAETYRQVIQSAPSLYEAHLFLADSLKRRRLNVEAMQEFLVARGLRPSDPLPYLSLADLHREAFRFSEALAVLQEAASAVPAEKGEAIRVARGAILRQAGQAEASAGALVTAAREYPDSARLQEAMGRSLMDLGRIDEAVKAFAAALERSPGNAAWEAERQAALDLLERLKKAEAQAKTARDAGAWESLARLRYQARQVAPAAVAASEALKLDKARSAALLLRALAVGRGGGKPQDAAADLKRIPASAPEHLLALYQRAYLARQDGDAAAEEKIWDEARRLHPEDPTSPLMLALCWKRSGSLEERLAQLRKQSGPNRARRKGESDKSASSDALLEALVLEELNRNEEAAKLYADAFMADPGNPEAAARLGGVLFRSPDLLRAWLKQGSDAGDDGKSQGAGDALLRAQLMENAGHREVALQVLRAAAKQFPGSGDIALAIAAQLSEPGGDEKEASAWLAKARQLNPSSPWPLLQEGVVLLKAGDAAGALKAAQQALELASDRVEAWELSGAARRLKGDVPGAIHDLSRALQMDPADSLGVARFQLALAQVAAGDPVAARQALEGDLPPFPDLIYRLAWSFAGRNFLDPTFHGQDWLAHRDRLPDARAQANDAYAAVAAMLTTLSDPYTRLRGIEETESLYLRARSSGLETDRFGAPTGASATVIAKDLGGDIGYLRLTNFSDPSSRETIRKALEKMAQEQGLVLDLRGNAGGLTSEADAIAGMFLEPGETLGIEKSSAGKGAQKAPQTRPVYGRKPLVILTDRRTSSAAEKLAAGLQGSGRATVLGESTFGKGAAQMSRLLPGGPMVLVTAIESLSPSGAAIQGQGVIPDVPAREDDSLEKAQEILKNPSP